MTVCDLCEVCLQYDLVVSNFSSGMNDIVGFISGVSNKHLITKHQKKTNRMMDKNIKIQSSTFNENHKTAQITRAFG